MTDSPEPPIYGSFNKRLLASSIDLMVILLIASPLSDWVVTHFYQPLDMQPFLATVTETINQDTGNPEKMITDLETIVSQYDLIGRVLAQNLPQLAIIALYVLPFWFRYSATPGKMLMKLSIRDAKTGERMKPQQAIVRFAGYLVSGLFFTLGFAWIVLNKKRRGWHDLMAGTVVVRNPKKKG